MDYIKDYSESIGKDLVSWDAYEGRYEPSELKFLANFFINNLCFIKLELQVNDSLTIAKLL